MFIQMANIVITLKSIARLMPFFEKCTPNQNLKCISYINPYTSSNMDKNVWLGRFRGFNFALSNKKYNQFLTTKKLYNYGNFNFFQR